MRRRSPLAGSTATLTVIAALMLQVVVHERMSVPYFEWAHLCVAVVVAALVGSSRKINDAQRPSALASFGVFSLFAMPFIFGPAQRSLAYWGTPFELQLAMALRNLTFGLAATRSNDRAQKMAAFASCFIALYGILWLMNRWNILLMFVYTIAGMWWLAGAYWSRISECFLTRNDRFIPWKPVLAIGLVGLLVVSVLLPLVNTTVYTAAINGYLPSSGGTRWQDDDAWGGVGDGMQLVSAKENASSFAPIESELFLESEMPSLYDCFDESAEPPPKKRDNRRIRAIPLAPSQMKENHERRGISQKPGREFQTARRRNLEARKVEELRSAELLQVAGRVPVHLGLYTYDLWDGHDLSSSNSEAADAFFLERRVGKKNWVRRAGRSEDALLTHRDQHEIRIINLKTDRVPAPPNLIGSHIDKVHTANFFTATQDGMLGLDMEFIPQLSVIHVESLCRRAIDPPLPVRAEEKAPDSADTITQLAAAWTAGVPPGWEQVEAICGHLQDEYQIDARADVPTEVEDVAVHFLRESKRGPDYLFAISAALLLRELGFEARVVSGFYANPKNYDRQARITSVFAEDAHFWTEVLTTSVDPTHPAYPKAQRHWIPIDPSPGYEVLYAPETVWATILALAVFVWDMILEWPVTSVAIAVFVGCVGWRRMAILDLLFTLWWRVRWSGDTRTRVLATLKLLDRRARLYGQPRDKAVSLGRWKLLDSANGSWGPRFVEEANWALYGGGFASNRPSHEIEAVCALAASSFRVSGAARTAATKVKRDTWL